MILVVKLTSMGDVLHLMPALTDLAKQQPDLTVDWMVEESFTHIPSWHPSVDRVIPVATRRWRRFKWSTIREFLSFRRCLRQRQYDVVVDAQGLIKSAVFARFAKLKPGGVRLGFCADSIKESFAARLYNKPVSVAREQHAIDRLRQLFAEGFDYQFGPLFDYGLITSGDDLAVGRDSGTVIFFHATTWESKHLPEHVWQALIKLAEADGYRVLLAWGNEQEHQRAKRLADGHANATVLDKMSLTDLKLQIQRCSGVIAVDTGLGHMAAALAIPCVSIYGSTAAKLTGAMGNKQVRLQSDYPCSPCFNKQCDKLSENVVDPPCYVKSDQNGGINASKLWESLFEQIA